MSFAVDLGAFARNAQGAVLKRRNGIALKLFAAVIRDTPVLTGHLRANWVCSKVDPLLGAIAGTDKGGATTIAKMSNTVLSSADASETLWLSNNLPYAYRIEFEGWSHTKSPDGMVHKNVARFQSIVNAQSVGL